MAHGHRAEPDERLEPVSQPPALHLDTAQGVRAIEHHKRAFELKPEFNESLLNLSAAGLILAACGGGTTQAPTAAAPAAAPPSA